MEDSWKYPNIKAKKQVPTFQKAHFHRTDAGLQRLWKLSWQSASEFAISIQPSFKEIDLV